MKILLTTHGEFAYGILESYKMIAGDADNIHAITLTDDGVGLYQEQLHAWLLANINEEVLILCDLKGGTPFNECYAYYLSHQKTIRLIAGLNLPMLIETALQLPAGLSLDEYAKIAYTTGKQEIFLAEDDEEETFEF